MRSSFSVGVINRAESAIQAAITNRLIDTCFDDPSKVMISYFSVNLYPAEVSSAEVESSWLTMLEEGKMIRFIHAQNIPFWRKQE
jgi:hypothetical protein